MKETLWLRAVRAAQVRGLLPLKNPSLTPREVAAQAAERGEKRLALIVDGWYYPASYGHLQGALTEEQAGRIVAELEKETQALRTEYARDESIAPVIDLPSKPRVLSCDLCGRSVMPKS